MRQGIAALASPGKEEFETYVRAVAQNRQSSPLRVDDLVGTTWRLAYSSDSTNRPPPDATVFLQFKSPSDMSYILKFGKRTLGLNAIQADCPWNISDSSMQQQLTFVYDKISCDAFGFKGIGTGLFGMLQGRSQTITASYYDGDYWIDAANNDNTLTVYVKEEDQDAWNK